MNNITLDAALKLLPAGGSAPPSDEGRLPDFENHLERARAERTAVNCPSPPLPTPQVCRAAPQNSGKSTVAHGNADDTASRNESGSAVEEPKQEDAPQHDEEKSTIDEVEISAGAVVTSTTESRDKESTDITNAELALKVARQQSPDATSANAVAKVAKQSATADPTAEGKLPANATTDAEVPLDPMAENSAKTPQRATRVKLATDVPGDKAAQAAHKRPQPTATVAEQATAAGKSVNQNAVAKAATESAAAGTEATEVVAAKKQTSVDGANGSRREPAAKQSQVAVDSATPFTQILVGAELSAAGTSVATANRESDSVDWSRSISNEGPAAVAESSAPVDTPREVADAGPRATASPQQGDARPTHSGRLEGIPVAGRSGSSEARDPISSADRVRLVQRVARALHSASERGGEVRLRLSPPELGSLRMEVIVQHGQLSAHIETETSAAKAVLLDNLPALRSRLAEQDITVARFDVDVMDNPAEGNHQQYDQDGDWSRQGGSARTNHAARSRSEIAQVTKAARTAPGSTGELDIVV